MENDERRGQRRMAAKLHFHLGSEPAQIVTVQVRYKECRVSQIVLGRNGLHLFIRQPFFQRTNRRGVAGKHAARKRIHLVNGNLQAAHAEISSSRPILKLGRCRLAINSRCSSSAETKMGMAMVESEWQVTMDASFAILPQLCASSKVQPERPPQCGASVTHCTAYLCPVTPEFMIMAVTSVC